MPESETNGHRREFLEYFSPSYIKDRVLTIPEESRPSTRHLPEDSEIEAEIVNNQQLDSRQKKETEEKLAERYWGSNDYDSIATDSTVADHFKTPDRVKSQLKKAIRVKLAVVDKGLEEVIKNKSFFDWLSEKGELGYDVTRDVGKFYVAMLEGLPMDKALKDKDPYKRNRYLQELLKFVGEYYFKKDHIVVKPQPGQAKYSVEVWREALYNLANKLSDDVMEPCREGIRKAAGSIVSLLDEGTPVTYSGPDSKVSNFIYVQEPGSVDADNIAMNDRGFKAKIFASANYNQINENFDAYLALPFMDLGCFYESVIRDPELKDIVPQINEVMFKFLDTGIWEVEDTKYEATYWRGLNRSLPRAAFEFGRLYYMLSMEVKNTNIRSEREKTIDMIQTYSANP